MGLNGRILFEGYDMGGKQLEKNPLSKVYPYWNPDVRTDENGVVNISFYTGDNTETFRVVIDGTTIRNENVFAERELEVKFGPLK